MSLVHHWWPVTHDAGFIDLPAARAAAEYQRWQEYLGRPCVQRSAGGLSEALDGLLPLSAEKRRALFLPTLSNWTVFLQSGIQGSDPVPALSELTSRLGVRGVRACATPAAARWQAVIMEVYAPADEGGQPPLYCRRSLAAVNDGGRWSFDESGMPFEFERSDLYEQATIKQRFPRELLVEYLGELGIRAFDDDFCAVSTQKPAFIVEKTSGWAEPAREYSLEQVLQGLPWQIPAR